MVSIDGRTLPTTIKMLGRGSCNDIPKKRITLSFGSDGSFVESFVSPNDAVTTYNSGFVEPNVGSLVIIGQRDTATVAGGVLRVKSSWDCGLETLIAQAK